MELYTINEEYINYLKQFSENVKYNKNEKQIGISKNKNMAIER